MPRTTALAVEGMASFSISRRFPQISMPGSRVIPVEIVAGSAEAGDQSRFQRVEHERNNRYCAGCRLEGRHDGIGSGDDHLRAAVHDLPSLSGITLVMPLGGIAFDEQVVSFDVAQAA
jgi:hypothetical protein